MSVEVFHFQIKAPDFRHLYQIHLSCKTTKNHGTKLPHSPKGGNITNIMMHVIHHQSALPAEVEGYPAHNHSALGQHALFVFHNGKSRMENLINIRPK